MTPEQVPDAEGTAVPVPADPRRSIRFARYGLVAFGLGLAGWGVYSLVSVLHVEQLIGLAIWLAGAVIIHDGVVAPLTSAARIGLARAGRVVPDAVRTLGGAGLVVGAMLTLIVVPEIHAKSLGTLNPTVLPSAYGFRLTLVWGAIALLVAGGSAFFVRRRRAG